mmetsp:Transcript_18729/g.43536  ORF Transcript_18729/g.43536 Transcript_18729/m.43536 type:complete len:315 (-) Transcript_18729:51-995(-)
MAKASFAALAVLVLARYTSIAEAVIHRGEPALKPELESPKSHNKFFKKDYPDDASPHPGPYKWEHPFPVVQASKDYDKDFVKDENNDHGEWAAQMEYDRLRNKVRDDKDKLAKAKGTEDDREKTLKTIKEKEEAAEKEAEAKEAAEKEKDGKLKEEDDRKHKKEEEEMKNVADGAKTVAKEVKSLEECEEELRKAKKKLQELMKEAGADEKAEEEAEKEAQAASMAQKAAEEYEKKMEKEESEEESEHTEAYKTWEEKQEAVEKMEKEMNEAEATLKRIRGEAAGAQEHSGSTRGLPYMASTLIAVLVAVQAMQ